MTIDLTPAKLTWRDGSPIAESFDDIYFNPSNGLAESDYVFLQGNQLPARWQQQEHFVIAETGFGTGLNFLLTWHTWAKTQKRPKQLHYIAFEKHPLAVHDLQKALQPYTELHAQSQCLLEHYPVLTPGFHTLLLHSGQIKLTLIFGDIADTLPKLDAQVDAWYLDGFAPSKNPDMWQPNLFFAMAKLSKPDTAFATFTAAGQVKRGLLSAGFQVEKTKGFGHKRERLIGHIGGQPPQRSAPLPKWCARPTLKRPRRVAIIGAGLAGCALAYRLNQEGIDTLLLEKESEIASGASGNPAGLLMPNLSPDFNLADQFYTQGFLRTKSYIQRAKDLQQGKDYQLEGLVQLMCQPRLKKWFDQLNAKRTPSSQLAQLLTSEQASALLGLPTDHQALFFPEGGWVSPSKLCQSFLENSPRTELLLNQSVISLKQTTQGQWDLTTHDPQLTTHNADAVIITCGHQSPQFPMTQQYPIFTSPGQLSVFATRQPLPFQLPVCGERYLIPLDAHHVLVGASYRRHDRQNHDVVEQEHEENYRALIRSIPSLKGIIDPAPVKGFVSCRPTTTDHLPLVGPVAKPEQFNQDFAIAARGGSTTKTPSATYQDGLYLCSGFCSRGISACLLSADILTAQILNHPLPVSTALYQALHPSRFWWRSLKTPNSG